MSIDTKYNKIKEAMEVLQAEKTAFDLLASLKTILLEATDPDGNIKIILDRNKQEITLPASILMSYVDEKKNEREVEVNKIIAKVDIKNGK